MLEVVVVVVVRLTSLTTRVALTSLTLNITLALDLTPTPI